MAFYYFSTLLCLYTFGLVFFFFFAWLCPTYRGHTVHAEWVQTVPNWEMEKSAGEKTSRKQRVERGEVESREVESRE